MGGSCLSLSRLALDIHRHRLSQISLFLTSNCNLFLGVSLFPHFLHFVCFIRNFAFAKYLIWNISKLIWIMQRMFWLIVYVWIYGYHILVWSWAQFNFSQIGDLFIRKCTTYKLYNQIHWYFHYAYFVGVLNECYALFIRHGMKCINARHLSLIKILLFWWAFCVWLCE